MNKIKLYWADKFRQLRDDGSLKIIDVINQFEAFCDEEEKRINDRWAVKDDNCGDDETTEEDEATSEEEAINCDHCGATSHYGNDGENHKIKCRVCHSKCDEISWCKEQILSHIQELPLNDQRVFISELMEEIAFIQQKCGCGNGKEMEEAVCSECR